MVPRDVFTLQKNTCVYLLIKIFKITFHINVNKTQSYKTSRMLFLHRENLHSLVNQIL